MKKKNILIKIKERTQTINCDWICDNCGELNLETYSSDDFEEKKIQCSHCYEEFIGKLN